MIIDFDDHSSTEGEISMGKLTAHGKVIMTDKDMIVLDSWHPTSPNTPRRLGLNEIETFIIVRKAVISIHRVTETEVL